MHRHTVHFNPLVSSELPLQSLYLKNPFVVDAEAEAAEVVIVAAFDLYVSDSAAQFGLGGVNVLSNYVLSLQNQSLRLGTLIEDLVGSGFGICLFVQVSEEEGHVAVDNDGDVEGGKGFGSGGEFGSGEVPENEDIGGELLGAMALPEEEGFDVEVERRGGGRRWGRVEGVVEEVEVERTAAEEGAGPGEGKDGEVGVVEAGGEVGVAGDWGRRGRRRGVVVLGGGGGAEARRESRGGGGVVAGH